jgi:hypothetical protein
MRQNYSDNPSITGKDFIGTQEAIDIVVDAITNDPNYEWIKELISSHLRSNFPTKPDLGKSVRNVCTKLGIRKHQELIFRIVTRLISEENQRLEADG